MVINKKKDELTTVQAGLNRETVTMLNNEEFIRFLGIWIGNKNHKKKTIARVKQDIAQIVSALKYKKITDKHTIYIYILNRILIPRIKYKIQHCHLSQKNVRYLQSNTKEY